jgi:hypothetical protein
VTLFVSTIRNLQAACPLASNHHLGVSSAKLDLPNWPAASIDLFEDYRRLSVAGLVAVGLDLAERQT